LVESTVIAMKNWCSVLAHPVESVAVPALVSEEVKGRADSWSYSV